MAAPLTRSIICPVLIGRSSLLDTLVLLIEQARSGHGQTVLIAGEAGIGKSRLVAEAIMSLRSTQLQSASPTTLILEGRCYEPDRSFPYAPLLDLLRSFLISHSPDDIASLLSQTAPELVKLLPEFANLFPEHVSGSVVDLEQEKRRLFQALLQLLTRLSTTQPLLVIIEDIHWSDDTSLEFLLFLAQRIASHPILLLLTYRSEEAYPVLTPLLAGLDRARLTTELTLSSMNIDEVGMMIRTILGLSRSVSADFLTAIYTLTEGNPFFIEEVLKSLVHAGEFIARDGGWERKSSLSESPHEVSLPDHLRLPRSVQLAVQQRLDHLSAEARDLLSLAAVAGRSFDFALLQQLTGHSESELVQLVKELIAAQLVVEEVEDVFVFRHALTRQAVYTDSLARERRALHRLVAETLERMYADAHEAHLGEIAYHFYIAREWGKVLEYAQLAGEKAQALYAPHAAIEQYTHALEAAQRQSQPPPLSLYRARGQCYELLGDFDAALNDYLQFLEAARAAHDKVAAWQGLLELGTLWTERDYEQAGDYFRRAIELAREMDDPAALAHTLNRAGNWYTNLEQPHEGLRYHLEALDIFRGLSDQSGLAETLDVLATTSLVGCQLIAAGAYYQQAIALLRTLGDHQRLISSLGMATMRSTNYLSNTLTWLTTSGAECASDAEEALTLARQMGWRSGEAFALIFLGLGLASQGEYSRAWMSAHAALDIALEIEHGLWITFAHFLLGSLSLDLLALSMARHYLEQALELAQGSGSLFWLHVITGCLASTCIAQRDFIRAESLLNAAAGANLPMQTLAQRIVWCALGELELARNHPDRALHIVDELISSANVEHAGVIPRLWFFRAEALIALKQTAEAEAVLRAALATAELQGTQPMLWRICLTLGELSATQKNLEQAKELFSQTRTIIEAVAATIPDEGVQSNFLHCCTALIPHLPQLSPRRTARQAFSGLTEREREVAALIAQGKTNRALADELIVSERTIEKHIERIMSKLGCTSRTQIALWANEKGLVKKAR